MTYNIMDWTEQRERVFLDRYARKDSEGRPTEKTPAEMWHRVCFSLARTADEYTQFHRILEGFRFVPAGRILNGVGSDTVNTLYNCFVISLSPKADRGADSRRAIMDVVSRMVEITSRGGGVGINWSTLRPEGARIRGVDGYSSGAVSWMGGADRMVDSIRQGGSRTAALMYILEDWHPDIFRFAEAEFLRANHSVAVSDKFMEAVRADTFWNLEFPDTSDPDYDTEWTGDLRAWEAAGHRTDCYQVVRARDLWDHLCRCAARTGNPGLVFLEWANEMANIHYSERLVSTNPCGEQLLPPNGSCNLGAVNLAAHYDAARGEIDHDLLTETVRGAVRLLDRVIDVSPPLDEEIDAVQRHVRRVGLGTMGLADLLILKGLRYGSAESLHYIKWLYGEIRTMAYKASVDLAYELGPAEGLDTEEFLKGKFVKGLPTWLRLQILHNGIRNLTLISQAPTGTTSILAGVSSGIEPNFSSEYVRRDATGEYLVVHPLYQNGHRGADYLVTAMDLPVADHVRVQGTVQKFSDNAVSKTINLPAGSTAEDVSAAYLKAYDGEEGRCKGITIYVAGSREGVLEVECPTGACEV